MCVGGKAMESTSQAEEQHCKGASYKSLSPSDHRVRNKTGGGYGSDTKVLHLAN